MPDTVYRFSDTYIHSAKRFSTVLAWTPTCLLTLMVLLSALDRKWITATVFAVACLAFAIRSVKGARAALATAKAMREVQITLSPSTVRVSDSDGSGEVLIERISRIKIARRQGSVRAVSIEVGGSEAMVITGINQLDQFASNLSRAVGEAKVGEYGRWQAHPN